MLKRVSIPEIKKDVMHYIELKEKHISLLEEKNSYFSFFKRKRLNNELVKVNKKIIKALQVLENKYLQTDDANETICLFKKYKYINSNVIARPAVPELIFSSDKCLNNSSTKTPSKS